MGPIKLVWDRIYQLNRLPDRDLSFIYDQTVAPANYSAPPGPLKFQPSLHTPYSSFSLVLLFLGKREVQYQRRSI